MTAKCGSERQHAIEAGVILWQNRLYMSAFDDWKKLTCMHNASLLCFLCELCDVLPQRFKAFFLGYSILS